MIPFEMRGRDVEEQRAIRAAEGGHPDLDGPALLVQALFAVALGVMLFAMVVSS